ncbi:MAG: ankyrin repeat domain-containing protein, partial [Cyanobacteria bacterium]|nr:ankyrin repeat domain-containing protein [Cyanobacteriota bacterium]
SMNGHGAILEKLLACPGIEVNAKDRFGKTSLVWAAEKGHVEIVEKLLAEPGIEVNSKINTDGTALMYASMSGHVPVIEKLLAAPGIEVNAKNAHGRTALMFATTNGRQKAVERLLAFPGIEVNAKDNEGKTAFILSTMYVYENTMKLFLDAPGIDVNVKDQQRMSALDWASMHKHRNIVFRLLDHPSLNMTPSEILKWKLKTFLGMEIKTTPDSEDLASKTLVSILPHILLDQSLAVFNKFMRQTESIFDNNPSQRNYHPNEAELLLFIKHPELTNRDREKISTLTQCLTSISHFIDIGAELSDQTLKTWGDIGFLTHGFRSWRYDAIGGSESLLAQFGFKPAPDDRPLNDVFGNGFILQDHLTGNLIEFRRGYLLISRPEKGTLVIRNSSPAFGRDLLKHPAYYFKKGLNREEILTFDPRSLNDQYSILHRDHYPNRKNSSHDSANAIASLTDSLLSLNTKYRKFKFDTEAFEQGEFKGHLSPGLPKLVNVLNMFQAKNIPLPDLAFTQSELPPYQPYYFHDADMKQTDRFHLTPAHLQELNDFVSGQWSEQKYPQSDWIRFIQQAGVENRGELVMLEPQGNK